MSSPVSHGRTSAPPALPTEVPSPCVDVCRMDPARGLCEGCLRTLDEIAAWGSLTEAGKRRVWALLDERRAAQAAAAAGVDDEAGR